MDKAITVETSARHVHLSQDDLEALFGKGAELTEKRPLSQPNQYLADQRVDIVGPKNTFKNVAILGPCRKATQVEISLTDARSLGVDAPIRESGDIAGSGSVKIVGPAGEITIKEGVIAAMRHIHATPEDAAAIGIRDKQIVSLRVGGQRGLLFDKVLVRVDKSYATRAHIDVDEANAAASPGEISGTIEY